MTGIFIFYLCIIDFAGGGGGGGRKRCLMKIPNAIEHVKWCVTQQMWTLLRNIGFIYDLEVSVKIPFDKYSFQRGNLLFK